MNCPPTYVTTNVYQSLYCSSWGESVPMLFPHCYTPGRGKILQLTWKTNKSSDCTVVRLPNRIIIELIFTLMVELWGLLSSVGCHFSSIHFNCCWQYSSQKRPASTRCKLTLVWNCERFYLSLSLSVPWLCSDSVCGSSGCLSLLCWLPTLVGMVAHQPCQRGHHGCPRGVPLYEERAGCYTSQWECQPGEQGMIGASLLLYTWSLLCAPLPPPSPFLWRMETCLLSCPCLDLTYKSLEILFLTFTQ